MRNILVIGLVVTAAMACAAQEYRIATPEQMRKSRPGDECRLEIFNRDSRDYGIDVDHRTMRLNLVGADEGAIYLPARSSVLLTFVDDEPWRVVGNDEILYIQLLTGKTISLRLDARTSGRRTGLVGIVDTGARQYQVQLLKPIIRGNGSSDSGRHRRTTTWFYPPPPPEPIRPPIHRPKPPRPEPEPPKQPKPPEPPKKPEPVKRLSGVVAPMPGQPIPVIPPRP